MLLLQLLWSCCAVATDVVSVAAAVVVFAAASSISALVDLVFVIFVVVDLGTFG